MEPVICCVNCDHAIVCIVKTDIWRIFSHNREYSDIFRSGQIPFLLQEISRNIAEKCECYKNEEGRNIQL